MLRRLSVILAWPLQRFEPRPGLAELAAMDARELADIGLTPQDLRDMTALPLGADPTGPLAQRAAERQALARRARVRRAPRRMAAD